jgi:hypothetical protein
VPGRLEPDVALHSQYLEAYAQLCNQFLMPGNPNECRIHAANCKRLAEQATTPEAREHFFNLAVQWERLAADLEGAKAFLDTMANIKKHSSKPLA